jgi:hypothetical protein
MEIPGLRKWLGFALGGFFVLFSNWRFGGSIYHMSISTHCNSVIDSSPHEFFTFVNDIGRLGRVSPVMVRPTGRLSTKNEQLSRPSFPQ